MFWDGVARVYDIFANIINRKAHRELCDRISEEVHAEDNVLECACGTGMISVRVAEKCRTLVATDFSRNMLKRARKKCASFSNITYAEADIMNLPYEDASFDLVIAGNVLHLLDDPVAAMRELERVCKKGGRIIVPTYIGKKTCGITTGKNPLTALVGKMGAGFRRHFTYESYRQFFEEAGYRDVRYFLAEGRLPCAVAIISTASSDNLTAFSGNS